MSDPPPSGRASRRGAAGSTIVAIAVVLAFVMFVLPRGLTRASVVTWLVASGAGVAVFVVAQAARRRRGN